MPPKHPSAPLVIRPDEGRSYTAFGSHAQFKLGAAQTGDTFDLAIASTPPNAGPPPHVHRSDDELFIVLEGEISFLLDGQWIPTTPGTIVYLPRGVPHTFRNTGTGPSRHCVATLPSGFETFYSRSASLFAAGGPPDPQALRTLAAEYGYEILGPPPTP